MIYQLQKLWQIISLISACKPHIFALMEAKEPMSHNGSPQLKDRKTCNWLKQQIELQVVYFSILFPCASVCTPTNLLCPCPPHPDKYGTWPFLNSEADLHAEYNLGIGEGERGVFLIKSSLWVCVWKNMYACSVFMWNSIVHVSVYTCLRLNVGLRNHMCLFVLKWLLLGVCMCVFVWVCKGSITMCAAGGLWSVSAPKAPRTWLDRCVWRT